MKTLAGLSAFICTALMASAPSPCSGQTSYSITDLGAIHSNGYSVAKGVNVGGEVMGAAGSYNTNISEVLYSNGEMSSLGTLGGNAGLGMGSTDRGR